MPAPSGRRLRGVATRRPVPPPPGRCHPPRSPPRAGRPARGPGRAPGAPAWAGRPPRPPPAAAGERRFGRRCGAPCAAALAAGGRAVGLVACGAGWRLRGAATRRPVLPPRSPPRAGRPARDWGRALGAAAAAAPGALAGRPALRWRAGTPAARGAPAAAASPPRTRARRCASPNAASGQPSREPVTSNVASTIARCMIHSLGCVARGCAGKLPIHVATPMPTPRNVRDGAQ